MMSSVAANSDDGFGDYDNGDWDKNPQPYKPPRHPFKDFRNERYSNAYGDYRGGYGPGGGFGQPRFFGPRPPFPPGPQFMWGRGFGPGGPPIRRFPIDDRAVKYLIRCGVAKEHLKNLPRDLLQLIEPQYCGLCAQSFDSFSMSRLHYISKNHLKSQKKWISQHSEMGFFGSAAKEIPMKSRELYCELCDVHITSKTHAESHYAGKPHRAIVEGRKNPRNPFLLQNGMENRLEQLIRREKKHLKPVEDDEEADEAPKETKSIQPELYCDICKTSVTCTEQMTMHLNGKKHLAKEKQHILKMMKGDHTFKNESVVESSAGDEEPAQGDGNGQDNFDWGNGSETWDEPSANVKSASE